MEEAPPPYAGQDSVPGPSNQDQPKPDSNGLLDRFRFNLFKGRLRAVKKYEDEQAELLESYGADERLILGGSPIATDDERTFDRVLARIAIVLNLFMLGATLTAAILSGSLSIISVLVESSMDLTTSIVITVALHLIKKTNPWTYPRGRERLEMVAVTLCAVIMGVSNTAMILQSVEGIVDGNVGPEMSFTAMGILLAGISSRFIFAIICFRHGTASSRVIAMDMRNDVFMGLVSMACAVVGDRYWKYADPIGAICVSSIIAISWFAHAIENIPNMVGVRADAKHMSRLLKITMEHDERIQKIDTIMLYHCGPTAFCEVHVVMNEELPLKVTHDVCHPLEQKLNLLDFVDRSFVHCDYFCDGD